MNNEDNKKNILKKIFALIILLIFVLYFVVLIYASITQNGNLIMAMLFSIFFTSIVLYIIIKSIKFFSKNL